MSQLLTLLLLPTSEQLDDLVNRLDMYAKARSLVFETAQAKQLKAQKHLRTECEFVLRQQYNFARSEVDVLIRETSELIKSENVVIPDNQSISFSEHTFSLKNLSTASFMLLGERLHISVRLCGYTPIDDPIQWEDSVAKIKYDHTSNIFEATLKVD